MSVELIAAYPKILTITSTGKYTITNVETIIAIAFVNLIPIY